MFLLSLRIGVTRRLLFVFRRVMRVSHWFKRRLTPAGSLVMGAMVGGGIFGVDTRLSVAYIIFSMAFSLMIISFIARGKIRTNFELIRRLPKFVMVGIPTRYTISIRNTTGYALSGLMLEERLRQPYPTAEEFTHQRRLTGVTRSLNWFDRAVGYPDWVEWLRNLRAIEIEKAPIPILHPGQTINIELELQPLHRGIAVFEYFGITRNDPIGLWRAIRDIPAQEALVVIPQIYPVRWPSFSGKRLHQRGGISQASHVGDSEEFRSLRDYRPGDPLRAIHWRSWARTGRPVVKEYQEEYFTRHALVLDTSTMERNDVTFEATLSIAISFAVTQPGADTLLDFLFVTTESPPSFPSISTPISHGREIKTITIGRGLGDTETLVRVLAGVKPSMPETFEQLASTVTVHATLISSAILVFQCWDESRARLVATLKKSGIGVRIYASENPTRSTSLPFPEEGKWIIPTRIREILAQT